MPLEYKPKLRKNFDIVYLEDNSSILFKSEHTTIKFEGKDTLEFFKKLIPLLDGSLTIDGIHNSLRVYNVEDIDKYLDLLIQNNIVQNKNDNKGITPRLLPQSEFLTDLRIPLHEVMEKIQNSTVGIIGLGGQGAFIASSLANEGIGHIKCIDPDIVTDEDTYFSSLFKQNDIGKRREQVLTEFMNKTYNELDFEVSNLTTITEKDIYDWINDCDIVIFAMDKGFSAVLYWVNKAALQRTPPLPWFSTEVEGIEGIIGPMIIPGETACYMCYKMRSIANENSFSDSISYNRYLKDRKKDESSKRSNLSIGLNISANFIALEVFKALTGYIQPQLLSKIFVVNYMNLNCEFHKILRKPNCPHCGIKKKNIEKNKCTSNILTLEKDLLSSRVGIIKSIRRIPKDASEPDLPYVFGAYLSNFNYETNSDDYVSCSGKGMTIDDAKMSTMGEAIERYCAYQYDETKIKTSLYDELPHALDPVELVLYSSEQYESGNLPYSKFIRDQRIGWIEGTSLISNKKIWVPAISVYLNYLSSRKELLISPTSNGLAAGTSYVDALLNGILEVIERDAFLITWMCKLPMPQVNLDSIQNKYIIDIVKMYERRNVEICINALILDTRVPTFMAIALDKKKGPAAVVGLSSHPNPEIGIYKALLEIGQIRPQLKREMRNPSYKDKIENLMNFENVKTIQDHELLYTTDKMRNAFDFLISNNRYVRVSEIPQCNGNSTDCLTYCTNNLAKNKGEIIFVDLTTSDIARLGLYTVRIIIPKFQPIHFGYDEARLGGDRLFELPQKLGFYDHRITYKELNLFPHPLG